tara:strand:+ start:2803 stop:3390 length:588 start_codon:yes stop_codon:yes gene_type:complete
MAIFRPEVKESSGTSFLGVIEVGIIGFTNRSKEFDWADLFIDIELSVKNSEYSNKMSIIGSLEKDSSGSITGGSVLNRMYKLFDAVGCKAGLTIKGKFEDEHGNEIADIASYLNERFTTKNEQYVAYCYKKKPKPGKKVYTEVYPRLYPNSGEGKNQCDSDATWLKEKGVIKEADASDMPQKNDNQLADNALNNL